MIITTAEQIRNLTGSYYANNDFEKIKSALHAVEDEVADIIGREMMEQLVEESKGSEGQMQIVTDDDQHHFVGDKEITVDAEGQVNISGYSPYGIICRVEGDTLHISNARAVRSCQQAIAYMATMRFYRLNDISHENAGRKVKIDKENEARPFEWQLARDDRAHLEEYYRALDRLIGALEEDPRFRQTATWKRKDSLVVKSAESLTWLTGVDQSPWLYMRMVPFLSESQRFVEKAYGEHIALWKMPLLDLWRAHRPRRIRRVREHRHAELRRADGRRPRRHRTDGAPHLSSGAALRADEGLRERRWRQPPGGCCPRPPRRLPEAPLARAALLAERDEAAARRGRRTGCGHAPADARERPPQ